MDGQKEVCRLTRVDLEDHGVDGDGGDIPLVEPRSRADSQPRSRPGVGHEVSHRVGSGDTWPTGKGEVGSLASPHHHDVAGLGFDAGQCNGGIEVFDGDRISRLQELETLGPGHVEKDPPRDKGANVVDPKPRRTLVADGRSWPSVVQDATFRSSAIGAVGQAVPVRGALHGEGDDVLGERNPLGIVALGFVDRDHRVLRVDPTFDESQLNPVGGGHGKAKSKGVGIHHGSEASAPRCLVDEIQGPNLVIGPPASPVGHRSHGFGKGRGYRGRKWSRHVPVVADQGLR